MSPPAVSPAVVILLSTYNGAAWLPEQLASFVAQEDLAWRLVWRDDGSSDESVAVMEAWAATLPPGQCTRAVTEGALGVSESYMALLREAVGQGAERVAFADQDDVWLPQKLHRALEALGEAAGPALYCSRQVLVDAELRHIALSAPIPVPPGLGPALTQNIATGCTVVLNRAAAALVAGSTAPETTLHDWWAYLVVAAAGGRVVADDEPTVLYRQHATNVVGAPRSNQRRAVAALRRGPRLFMRVLRANVAGLLAQPGLLSAESRVLLDAVSRGLAGGVGPRLGALRLGLLRQTRAETLLFRAWFLMG